MAHWGQVLPLVAAIGTFGTSESVSAQSDLGERFGSPTVTVRVDDKTGVQGALLQFAEARASEVFTMSCVHVEWIDGADADRQHITADYMIVIMTEAPPNLRAAMRQLGTDVMGQAAPSVGRAYIYYDRITAFKPVAPRDIPTTLGDVMAHELGHLMLPPGHSVAGIMQPTINRGSRRLESFTDVEAALVREAVAGADASCAIG